jgi:hypothetical protein
VIVCAGLNFFFFPGISWMFRVPLQSLYTELGRNVLTRSLAEEKMITSRLSQDAPGARVLYPNGPFGATLKGTPLYVNWYSPKRASSFSSIKKQEDAASFIRAEKVQFAILNLPDQSRPGEPNWLLREYMSRWGYPEYQVGSCILYRVAGDEVPYREVFKVNGQIMAVVAPKLLAVVLIKEAMAARYQVSFRCLAPQGAFVVQLKWDVGPPHHRLVPCEAGEVAFSESVPVPAGASQAELFVSVRDVAEAQVLGLTVGVN